MMKSNNSNETKNDDSPYTGFLIELLDALGKEAKFKYQLQEVEDGKYGSEVNGKWIGMIGEVVDGV